jgi:hypothetical protein
VSAAGPGIARDVPATPAPRRTTAPRPIG